MRLKKWTKNKHLETRFVLHQVLFESQLYIWEQLIHVWVWLQFTCSASSARLRQHQKEWLGSPRAMILKITMGKRWRRLGTGAPRRWSVLFLGQPGVRGRDKFAKIKTTCQNLIYDGDHAHWRESQLNMCFSQLAKLICFPDRTSYIYLTRSLEVFSGFRMHKSSEGNIKRNFD